MDIGHVGRSLWVFFFSECETYFVNQRAEKMSCFGKLFWVYKIEMNGFNSQKM